MALYADDTKIWCTIYSENDHRFLQNDIDYLMRWAHQNKMNFHPRKCKVLSVATKTPPLLGILPGIQFIYCLGENPLDYIDSEKDLGIHITPNLNWTDHCNSIYNKANQI